MAARPLASRNGLDHVEPRPATDSKSRLGDRCPISTNALLFLNEIEVIGRVEFIPTGVAEDTADEASMIGITAAITVAAIGQVWAQVPSLGTQQAHGAPCPYPFNAPTPEGCVSSGLKTAGT